MVNMKLSDQAYKDQPQAIAYDKPQYPYGLEISLDNDCLAKLGIDEVPEVGDVLTLKAKVIVKSTMESDSLNGGENCCMSLQITDMELGGVKPESSAAAKKLYGE